MTKSMSVNDHRVTAGKKESQYVKHELRRKNMTVTECQEMLTDTLVALKSNATQDMRTHGTVSRRRVLLLLESMQLQRHILKCNAINFSPICHVTIVTNSITLRFLFT